MWEHYQPRSLNSVVLFLPLPIPGACPDTSMSAAKGTLAFSLNHSLHGYGSPPEEGSCNPLMFICMLVCITTFHHDLHLTIVELHMTVVFIFLRFVDWALTLEPKFELLLYN